MGFKKINIFSSSDICVDFFENLSESDVLVVTFTERGNRNISDFGFGTSFLLGHGFDVVAVKTNLDFWYENLTQEKIKIISGFIYNIGKNILK